MQRFLRIGLTISAGLCIYLFIKCVQSSAPHEFYGPAALGSFSVWVMCTLFLSHADPPIEGTLPRRTRRQRIRLYGRGQEGKPEEDLGTIVGPVGVKNPRHLRFSYIMDVE